MLNNLTIPVKRLNLLFALEQGILMARLKGAERSQTGFVISHLQRITKMLFLSPRKISITCVHAIQGFRVFSWFDVTLWVMGVRFSLMMAHSRWVHRSSRLGSHRKDGKHEELLAAFNLRRILQ